MRLVLLLSVTISIAAHVQTPDLESTHELAHGCFGRDVVLFRKERHTFVKDVLGCGTECMGSEGCIADCMHDKHEFSHECSQCFGELGGCAIKTCLKECMNLALTGEGFPECKACTLHNCEDSLFKCTKLPPKEIDAFYRAMQFNPSAPSSKQLHDRSSAPDPTPKRSHPTLRAQQQRQPAAPSPGPSPDPSPEPSLSKSGTTGLPSVAEATGSGKGCCFEIGYGDMMKPCCLKARPHTLKSECSQTKQVGGAGGFTEGECPLTAEAAKGVMEGSAVLPSKASQSQAEKDKKDEQAEKAEKDEEDEEAEKDEKAERDEKLSPDVIDEFLASHATIKAEHWTPEIAKLKAAYYYKHHEAFRALQNELSARPSSAPPALQPPPAPMPPPPTHRTRSGPVSSADALAGLSDPDMDIDDDDQNDLNESPPPPLPKIAKVARKGSKVAMWLVISGVVVTVSAALALAVWRYREHTGKVGTDHRPYDYQPVSTDQNPL